MANVPQTYIALYFNPNVDTSYKNVVNYTLGIDSYLSLLSQPKEFYDATYVRRDGVIDLPISYNEALKYNYIVYNNNEGDGKEYAFVMEVEFINFSMTRIKTKYDSWTNNFYTIKSNQRKCTVVRKHMNPFNFATLPRLIDSGYNASISKDVYLDYTNLNVFTIAISFKYGYEGTATDDAIYLHHQIYDSASMMFFSYNYDGEPQGDITSLNDLLSILNSSKIKSAYILPISMNFANTKTIRIFDDDSELSAVTGYYMTLDKLTKGIDVSSIITIDNVDGDDYMIYSTPYTKYFLSDDKNTMEIDRIEIGEQTTLPLSGKLFVDNSGVYIHYGIPYTYEKYDNPRTSFNTYFNIEFPRYVNALSEYLETQGYKDFQSIIPNSDSIKNLASKPITTMVDFAAETVAPKYIQYSYLQNAYPIVLNDGAFTKLLSLSTQPLHLKIVKYELFESEKNVLYSNWNKYGYLVNSLETPTFRTREHYNYIQTDGYIIPEIIHEIERIDIESAFNNGLTIWHHIDANINLYGNYYSNNQNTYIGG